MELYDLKKDAPQLKNVVKDASPQFLAAKHSRLVDLATSSGNSCRKTSSESKDVVL